MKPGSDDYLIASRQTNGSTAMKLISNSMKRSSLTMALLVLATGAAQADGLLGTDLLGNPYQIITSQQGNHNAIEIVHQGSELLSNVEQIGNDNQLTLNNNGDHSLARVSQIGDGNRVSMDLENSNQRITVIQRGNRMGFKVYQN